MENTHPSATSTTPQEKALASAGVTPEIIEKLKAAAAPLRIESADDKAGYEQVRKARLACKKLRTTATKTCKEGRAAARKEVDAWLSAEKQVVATITEVEQPLADAEEWFDNEKKRIAAEAEAARRQKIEQRIDAMTAVGAGITYAEAERLSDDEFATLYAEAEDAFEMEQERKADEERQRQIDAALTERAAVRVAEFAALGEHLSLEAARALTDDQYEKRRQAAADAKAVRDAEETERQRLEQRTQNRLQQLSKYSTHIDYNAVHNFDDELFADHLANEKAKHDERVAERLADVEPEPVPQAPPLSADCAVTCPQVIDCAECPDHQQPAAGPSAEEPAPAPEPEPEAPADFAQDGEKLTAWLDRITTIPQPAMSTDAGREVAALISRRLAGYSDWATSQIKALRLWRRPTINPKGATP